MTLSDPIRCQKCGSGWVETNYIGSADVLRRRCVTCGFIWRDVPLDRATRSAEKREAS